MNARQHGFTLLELLVATAIVVVIGAAAAMKLSQAMNVRDRVNERAEDLAQLQRAFLFIGRDMEQIVARPARDELGDAQSFLQTNPDGSVELTRVGWINPLSSRQRGDLQRVRYRFEGGQLLREYWENPDRQAGAAPVRSVLTKDVTDFRVEFLFQDAKTGFAWFDTWPLPEDLQRAPQYRRAPLAVSVEVTTARHGAIKRFFRVAANPHAKET